MTLSSLDAAYCQIGSEAFLHDVLGAPTEIGQAGLAQMYSPSALTTALITGNGLYTKLTQSQAEAFVAKYQVLYTYPNDATGLSFTVFGVKDANGQLTGEKVLSIRSTEFDPVALDGAAFRDNADIAADRQLTANGYAYYQLAALTQAWDDIRPQLSAAFVAAGIPDGPLNVTGYSLSANIAAGFTQLEVAAGRSVENLTLFNGAGVGSVSTEALAATITDLRAVLTPELLATGIQSDDLYDNAALSAVLTSHSAELSSALWHTSLGNVFGPSVTTVPFSAPGGEILDVPVTNLTGWDGVNMVAALGLRFGEAAPVAIDHMGLLVSDVERITNYLAAEFEVPISQWPSAMLKAFLDIAGPGHSIVKLLQGLELHQTLVSISDNIGTLQQSNDFVRAFPSQATCVSDAVKALAEVLAPTFVESTSTDASATLQAVIAAVAQLGQSVTISGIDTVGLDTLESSSGTSAAARFVLTSPAVPVMVDAHSANSALYSERTPGNELQWANEQYRQDRTLAFAAETAVSDRAQNYYAAHYAYQTLTVMDARLGLTNSFAPLEGTLELTPNRIVFGAANAGDSVFVVQGDATFDHLYGAPGNTLLGKTGDDLLISGGENRLEGGVGYDTYYVLAGDTVLDEDGKGEVHVVPPALGEVSYSRDDRRCLGWPGQDFRC